MVRRTFVAVAAAVAATGRRLWAQSRGEQIRMLAEQLASTSFRADDIMAMDSSAAAAVLEDPASSEFARAKACQRLAVVGEDPAVPALARLLADQRLGHYARTALEPMASETAAEVLRDALGSLEGDLLVGVINSIGWRRDTGALDRLAELRHGEDRQVAAAATWAINRIRRP